MLPFVDDESDDVGTFISQGLGPQRYSHTSDQAIRNSLDKTWWSPREQAKMYALGISRFGPAVSLFDVRSSW
jgi:hypothetical protein